MQVAPAIAIRTGREPIRAERYAADGGRPARPISCAPVADAPFAPPALESKRPVPRPALGYALVWSAVMLWSLNAVIAKIVLDSAGLSAMRLARGARDRRRADPRDRRRSSRARDAADDPARARRSLRSSAILGPRLRPALLLRRHPAARHRDRARHQLPRAGLRRALGALLRARAGAAAAVARDRAQPLRAVARRRALERRLVAGRGRRPRLPGDRPRLRRLRPHGRAIARAAAGTCTRSSPGASPSPPSSGRSSSPGGASRSSSSTGARRCSARFDDVEAAGLAPPRLHRRARDGGPLHPPGERAAPRPGDAGDHRGHAGARARRHRRLDLARRGARRRADRRRR